MRVFISADIEGTTFTTLWDETELGHGMYAAAAKQMTAEVKAACEGAIAAGADYIKTSTGFSTAGATFADVELFAKHVAPHVKIKAAGGISSIEDAEKFIALGADRLGTSRIVKIAKGLENDGTY